MVAMGKTAWFALMNWKTRTRSPRSPVRTRLPPLPRCRAPGAVAGSHAADASVPRAQRWSGRPVGGFHRDRPDEPSSRSPGQSARTHATAPPGFAHIGPDQPSVAGIPADRVGDSSASIAPPSQVERCPPNRVNSNPQQIPRHRPDAEVQKARLAVHHRSACSGVKALPNTSDARRQAAKLCYRFGPLTPSARSANLIAGDGTKNGLPAPNKEPATKPKKTT